MDLCDLFPALGMDANEKKKYYIENKEKITQELKDEVRFDLYKTLQMEKEAKLDPSERVRDWAFNTWGVSLKEKVSTPYQRFLKGIEFGFDKEDYFSQDQLLRMGAHFAGELKTQWIDEKDTSQELVHVKHLKEGCTNCNNLYCNLKRMKQGLPYVKLDNAEGIFDVFIEESSKERFFKECIKDALTLHKKLDDINEKLKEEYKSWTSILFLFLFYESLNEEVKSYVLLETDSVLHPLHPIYKFFLFNVYPEIKTKYKLLKMVNRC